MRSVPSPPPEPDIQLCAFFLGAQEFVVDIRRVEEILHPLPITPLPRAPAFLEGVIHLRGTIVPVVDPRKQLGLTPRVGGKPKMLICLAGRRKVALLVDGVTQVLKVKRSELKPAPSPVGPEGVPYVLGVYGQPERLWLLLNVKALLGSGAPVAGIAQGVVA